MFLSLVDSTYLIHKVLVIWYAKVFNSLKWCHLQLFSSHIFVHRRWGLRWFLSACSASCCCSLHSTLTAFSPDLCRVPSDKEMLQVSPCKIAKWYFFIIKNIRWQCVLWDMPLVVMSLQRMISDCSSPQLYRALESFSSSFSCLAAILPFWFALIVLVLAVD